MNQLDFLFQAPVAIDLPERVRVVSLWRPYAELVVLGVKSLETRTWAWPYPPSWLAIYATETIDTEAVRRIGKRAEEAIGPGRHLLGLVWVVRSAPLLPEDEPRSLFYAPGRMAWELEKATRFPRPVPLSRTGLKSGPQKFASVDRRVILDALADRA